MWVITNLESKLLTELKTISDFVDVYDYHIIKNEGFPYWSFELLDFEGEVLDTCENKRFWTFKLVIFQEMTNITREEAKDTLYSIAEKVIELFDKNQFLDWLVDNTEVINWSMDQYADKKWWKTLFLEMNIKFETTLNIKN